jgi:transcriptional regulator with XRE-family HTH domain
MSPYYPEAWGKILRDMRLELEISQETLGRKIFSRRTLISRWENGQACDNDFKINRLNILRLARVFAGRVTNLKRPADVVDWMSLIGFCPSDDELAEMKQDKAWKDGINLAWVSRYQVPPLPRPHVVRNDLMDQTKHYILNELVDNAPLVLTGTPGAGKSTLAAALAADREIRVALPYAVLWAQVNVQQSGVSSNDQLIPVLRKWRQALGLKADLTNDRLFGWLNTWVKYERALLVIDNVSSYQTVEPLLVDSRTCRTIITTRNRGLVRHLPVKSRLVDVGQLQPDESRQLLEEILGATTEPIGVSELEGITARLGGNALALELAAKEIKIRGFQSMMAHLNDTDGGRLAVLSQTGEDDPDQSVWKSFTLSYRQLNPDYRRCYRALGQLPGASRFTVEIFQALAEFPQRYEAQVTLDHFVGQSLLQVDGKGYRLHPLLFEYARRLLKEADEWDPDHRWIQRYTGGLVEEWRRWRPSFPRPSGVSRREAGGWGAWIKAGLCEFRTFRPAIQAARRRRYDEALTVSWDPDDIPLDHWIALKQLQHRYQTYLRRLWLLAAALGGWVGLLLLLYLLAYIPSIRPWLFRWRMTILYLSSIIPLACVILPLWLGTVHLIDLHRLWNAQ